MKFLRNVWYVAAWASEITPQSLVYRKIIGEPVLLTRREDGVAVAMSNVCPHRFAPLHLGCKKGGNIRCNYHGLEFNTEGKCVRNPNAPGTIPAALEIPVYPLVEKHTLLWIWLGDQPADESLIPDYSIMQERDDGLWRDRGHFTMDVNVELVANNLMDLSHSSFLHEGLLGTQEHAQSEIEVSQEGNTVTCTRWARDVPVPKVSDLIFRRDGKNVDFWTIMRWDPACCFLLDVGCHAPGETREQGAGYIGIHILTPETETTTHYHVGIVKKPSSEEDAELQAEIKRLRLHAFKGQDEPMMVAMQEMLGVQELLTRKPVLLSIDAGPVRIERVLQGLLAKE
jgi:vanillate O-demethylase monooxygenase subunit